MTTVATRPDSSMLWGAMPGWGIAADLTPPELTAARGLRTLRRAIAVGLLAVVLLCAVGFGYAMFKESSASDAAAGAGDETTALQARLNEYSTVTNIEQQVQAINSQLATTMTSDVDLNALLTDIQRALPTTMTVQNLGVTPTAAGTPSTDGLDQSGQQQIATLVITGNERAITDLATFVDRLAAVKGVINVVPTSNQDSNGKLQWTVNLSVSTARYSHHYDQKPGAN